MSFRPFRRFGPFGPCPFVTVLLSFRPFVFIVSFSKRDGTPEADLDGKNMLRDYIPKSYICWKEGYTWNLFLHDLMAGATVGIIALPLAMAFAIGSGVPPERGLYTAIVAGFLISLLGGSRVQISGPTGAFVVIIYSVVQRHGYEGLAIATLMAGAMMILMGLARFGVILKFIPYPVTTGFTTGIALIIFSSQIKDFFGLDMPAMPSDFVDKWRAYFCCMHTWNPWAFGLGLGSLVLIFGLRRYYPKIPGVIVAVILATLAATLFDLPIETIEKKFGEIPRTLPKPYFPAFSLDRFRFLFSDAWTIALLGAIESLLSAVVADGMTGHKHRSNCELVAQGFGNIGSIIFGGIPATGAIARTTANIKMGAKTPMAGMIHAVTLVLLMLFFAPLASKVPLCVLAAILFYIAWNMSELDHCWAILKGPISDVLVLLITFLLTILVDLTMAVQVGIILAAILFLKKMTDSTTVEACKLLISEDEDDPEIKDSELLFRDDVPDDVAIFEINGPFFFGISDALNEELRQLPKPPKVFILRMHKVPIIDASGIHALKKFKAKCDAQGILFCLSGVRKEVQELLKRSEVEKTVGKEHIFKTIEEALAFAKA